MLISWWKNRKAEKNMTPEELAEKRAKDKEKSKAMTKTLGQMMLCFYGLLFSLVGIFYGGLGWLGIIGIVMCAFGLKSAGDDKRAKYSAYAGIGIGALAVILEVISLF